MFEVVESTITYLHHIFWLLLQRITVGLTHNATVVRSIDSNRLRTTAPISFAPRLRRENQPILKRASLFQNPLSARRTIIGTKEGFLCAYETPPPHLYPEETAPTVLTPLQSHEQTALSFSARLLYLVQNSERSCIFHRINFEFSCQEKFAYPSLLAALYIRSKGPRKSSF